MKSKLTLFLLGLLCIFSCSKETIIPDPDGSDDPVVTPDTWGQTTITIPTVYAASDVSQATIDLTLKWYKIATDAWGNYGNIEIWIVGESTAAAQALDVSWCTLRAEKDPKWDTTWDCVNGDPYGAGTGWSPFHRYVTEGGAAVSTYIRDYTDNRFLTITMSAKYPGPEEEDYKPVTLHEVFHTYQHVHISDKDEDVRTIKMGGKDKPWWAEGSAEYMAQLLYSRQPGVSSEYLKESMEEKYNAVADYKTLGKSLKEITYDDGIGYDIGAWFIAYLTYNEGEEKVKVDFYKDLNSLGFEGSFKNNFEKTSDEYLVLFDTFLDTGKVEALKIIP
jgi:hypothetical protein